MARTDPTWKPQESDYHQIFEEQNPWRLSSVVPEVLAPRVQRSLAQHLWNHVRRDDPHRFQILLGPRRVGKSTAMYQTVSRLLAEGVPANLLWWLRLDHPLLMPVELGDLIKTAIRSSRCSEGRPLYLFLDEITYAKKWDLWLKTFFDERWPVRVVGTSSATAILRDRRQESGIGRWDEQYLSPYLFHEYLALTGRRCEFPISGSLSETLSDLADVVPTLSNLSDSRRRFILTGGFPELLLRSMGDVDEANLLISSQRTLRADAVERAIYKDIPQAHPVTSPMMLERVLYSLAGQVAGIFSPQKFSGSLGMSVSTLDRYIAYLERAFLIFSIPNYSGSELATQKRGRKIYFTDGAVRNAALQRGTAPLHDPSEMGLLFENLAAGHLHALGQQSGVRLYHWRDHDDEVDLVFDHPERPLAFEIASSSRHHRSGLRAFIERYPRFRGRCFLVAPDGPYVPASADSGDGIGSLPLDCFLIAVGLHAEAALSARLGYALPQAEPNLFTDVERP